MYFHGKHGFLVIIGIKCMHTGPDTRVLWNDCEDSQKEMSIGNKKLYN